ncbi:peptidase S8 and S53 subtilisin kexin sedolisin [Caldithrix abyssi DSM 13497]|uniref:Peptidase S8 and S53 subtilisin kexin sedolisin n=1 Tax=Caldithrix abyssi DSM 13497 TaxID=880073 RepID=H1XS11_CALAY|nr:S8 family serine peptidase [Caldithrix abyssi]APF18504.1 Por secretion system C-terminal sorting domain-containing protein [Caldithrix abyssi DSM 13497]EHO42504.1 peptidase S8 and S53 subtilisin kexin sedolisin [Caldithrix abyssi DSM 13497]
MSRFFKILIGIVLIVSGALQASSFVGFKKNVISVKIDEKAFYNLRTVQFTIGKTGIQSIDALNEQYKVRLVKNFFKLKADFINERNKDLQQWLLFYFETPIDVEQISREYASLADVLVAEPIPIHTVFKTPDDTRLTDQWHINQSNDADIDAFEAWDMETGNTSIIVAVMDTGVEWWHPDLAGALADRTNRNTIHGNIWINTAELADTNSTVDEDGNGYADDWVGWDFVTGNPNLLDLGDDYDQEDNDPSDHEGHGTHCAGNVGAINNNALGVCSAAGGWGEDAQGAGNGVKVMPLRIGWKDFPSGRVSMDFAAQAFIYAAENGAHIASCSWGSSETTALKDAINTFLYGTTSPTASDPQIRLIFVAAGNDGNESQAYLNSRDDCISVAATNANDGAPSWTNYGTWIDISAPGENILSTSLNGGYASLDGTSMATPIAASVAALIWSYQPSLTATEVENYLYQGAENIDANLPATHIGKMGAGRVSAWNSLSLITPNQRPVAMADTSSLAEDDSVKIAVLNNDSDPDGDPLQLSVLTSPQNGSVTQLGDTLRYVANQDFFGSDSFQYKIDDGNGGLDTAMVRITVRAVNDPPQIVGLPQNLILNPNDCTSLNMANYQQDVDTPDSLLQWSFSVSDPTALSYTYNPATDTLEICSLGPTGTYFVYTTLTDDSGAFDQDTITVTVELPSALAAVGKGTPDKFDLKANYPNPFNPQTTIAYQLAENDYVSIRVYDITGRLVSTLVDETQKAGYYKILFDARHLSSGIYFYVMRTSQFVKMRKMMLIR